MKILVTGVAGQLGHDVMEELHKRGHEPIGSDIVPNVDFETASLSKQYVQMDITDETSVGKVLNEVMPDAVIHCAAWTAVDAAEEVENADLVYAINVTGTKNIAEACKKKQVKMLYISTDYVFDGQGDVPWEPDCKAYAPLNVYGKTKLEGELAVSSILDKYYVVRIAWVFGIHGKNFVKTMLNVGQRFESLKVVDDQIGTPTYTYDLSRLLADMIESDKYGYYHVTNEGGYISWYEFAKEIFAQASELGVMGYQEKMPQVIPVTTEEYGISKAKRPFNSRLNKEKLVENGFVPLPEWKDALNRYLKEMMNQEKQ